MLLCPLSVGRGARPSVGGESPPLPSTTAQGIEPPKTDGGREVNRCCHLSCCRCHFFPCDRVKDSKPNSASPVSRAVCDGVSHGRPPPGFLAEEHQSQACVRLCWGACVRLCRGPLWHLLTFCNDARATFPCLITACLLKLCNTGLLQLPVEDET